MRTDNLAGGELEDLMRRVRALERATPLNNASIGRNGLRVHDGGVITIENGGLKITGTAEVIGSLIGSGVLTWSGPVTLTGTTNLNGPVTIAGAATLSSILTVTGSIKSGSSTFDATGLSNSGILFLQSPQVSVSADLVVGGGTQLSGSSVKMSNLPTTSSAANMYIDPTTKAVMRVTSARRFKIGPRKMTIPASLLDVPMKDWIDKGARWRKEPDVRVPGQIAEEVEAAGGIAFITRGPDGEIEGLAYDRLALARTQLLNEKLDAALKRIEHLEAQIAGR